MHSRSLELATLNLNINNKIKEILPTEETELDKDTDES